MKEKKKILIIEDDPTDFENLKNLLESKYSIMPDNFEEMAKAIDPNSKKESIEGFVLRQIKDSYKDLRLILCDIFLGDENEKNGKNGLSVVKYIRNLHEYDSEIDKDYVSEIPIIAITIFAHRQVDILDAGADFSISKPKIKDDSNYLIGTIDANVKKFENYLIRIIMKPKVFIVHGHDEGTKEKIARFLEKMRLDPIILHEKANEGLNILDKFEKNTDVIYAVVLYTSCDRGKDKDDTELKPRARQNVVFEHGYLISKLGRNKVCALVEKNVEIPSDIAGLLYLSLENDNWKIYLCRELRRQGIIVDMNLI